MLRKNKTLSLQDATLVSGGKILLPSPLTVERDNEEAVLEFQSQGTIAWRAEEYLVIDFKAEADSKIPLFIEFYAGEEKLLVMDRFMVPNRRVKMVIHLEELASKRWFLTPMPGSFKGHVVGMPTHIDKIDRVRICFRSARDDQKLTVFGVELTDTLPELKVEGGAMVDRFGQRIDAEWEGKIHSEEELTRFLQAEYAWAKEHSGYLRKDLSIYGGWKKKKFDATGFFHKAHDGRRWWLVDPEGYAFYSNGICYGCRMGVFAMIRGMENLFEWLPDREDPTYQNAWTVAARIPEFAKRNPKGVGEDWTMFNFARANMIRVFGENWWDAWVTINGARLKQWGFNTVSLNSNQYEDENVMKYVRRIQIPYSMVLKRFPKTKYHILRDFPDVFSPEYEQASAVFAEQLRPYADDPYLIGYFINNEPEWAVVRGVNIAAVLLQSTVDSYSKRALGGFLQKKYATAQELSQAWGAEIASLECPVMEEVPTTEAALADLEEFNHILQRKYVRVPYDALRAVDSHHLCMGNRYAGLPGNGFSEEDALYDIFSVNGYRRNPTELCDQVAEKFPNPVLLGEWMFGARERSHLSNALINAANPEERGKAMANYMQYALAHKHCVGMHYFEWNDEPCLGTYDGQNMPHGLIDVNNRPQWESIQHMVAINEFMYEFVNGDRQPQEIEWQYSERF